MPTFPFALQLYSIRDHMEQEVASTLRTVKAMGYDHVELAGSAGLMPAEYKALLDDIGLTVASCHVPYDAVIGNVEGLAGDCKTFQTEFVVVPWLGGEDMDSADAWVKAAREMDRAGAYLREQGIRLCYHNHNHEFAQYDGRTAYSLICENSDPENLGLQVDTCWVHIAGEDPCALLREQAGRVPLVHVKDYVRNEAGEHRFTELGRGVMDLDAVLQAAREAGAQWYIVEQDTSEQDTLESARINAAFMARRAG